jgi:Ca2+-binding EF-hand superfamily protein
LHLEELARRHQSFSQDSLDVDRLSFFEMMPGASSLFRDRLFAVFDLNGDGRITLEEYLTAVTVLSAPGVSQEKIELTFRLWDLDGDGGITHEELATMVVAASEGDGLIINQMQAEELVACTFGIQRRPSDEKRKFVLGLAEYSAMVRMCPRILDMWQCETDVARSPRQTPR